MIMNEGGCRPLFVNGKEFLARDVRPFALAVTLVRMSDPAAPPVGADEESSGKSRYKSGPWLLVFGHGLTSESRASAIALQCDERGVSCESVAVDEVYSIDLKLYLCLVVVLPTAGESAQSLELFVEVINAYRSRRRAGLDLLLLGRQKWWQVGVVQVLHEGADPPQTLVRSTRGAVCRYLPVNSASCPAPFAAYETASLPGTPESPASSAQSTTDAMRNTVTSWGVAWNHAQIAEVRQFIDGQRDIYENPRYIDLRRPIPGNPGNRLDYVLDKPTYKPDPALCDGTKWTEGGKRVVNRTLGELQVMFPLLRRPPAREGRKNLQREFHEFYRALSVAEQFFKIES